MDKRISVQTSKKPANEGKVPQSSSYSTFNTRSPHQDGNHYRLTSSSSSTVSSYSETGSSLERKGDSVSVYGHRPTGEFYSDRQVNSQSVHRTGPLAYHPHANDDFPYQTRPPTNYMSYPNDVQMRHSGRYERPSDSGFIPATPVYYEQVSAGLPPHNHPEDRFYGPGFPGQSDYNVPYKHVCPPLQSPAHNRQHLFDYRQSPNPSIVRANSTGSHRRGERRPQHPLDSQRGYSSLGDATLTTPHLSHPLESSREGVPNAAMTREDSQPYRIGNGGYHPPDNVVHHNTSSRSTATAAMNRLVEDTAHVSISGDQDWDSLEIVEHPKDVCVAPGEKVVFSCRARVRGEDEEVNMLWCKDREPLIGEIDSEFTIEETTERDEGVYHCLVSHPINSTMKKESQPANLVVKEQGNHMFAMQDLLP